MAVHSNLLQRLNNSLPDGWEAKLIPEQGRIYYSSVGKQLSSWIPPTEHWDPGSHGLPYGWECAYDKGSKPYFINHVDKYTTRDDPRDDPDYVEPPKPRDVELVRDPQKGFGFVAGSEKPVVVRFVTDGGPSVDKLLPGDQIIRINGEDVKKAQREYVIDLVRSCKHSITLTVCQPYADNSTRKSALLTAAKKAKLKNNPSRVRFAENVTVTMVNGAPLQSPSSHESYVPFMPNVLKVFLENGQTKSFKYDNKTTVKDVVHSLQEKLNIKCVQHFNLVLQNVKAHTPTGMTLLQEHETLAEIAAKPGARHFRCLFRVMFVPRDAYDLLKEDPVAFEYFYLQCCNDVVHERFTELKGDIVFKLAALQMQQHAISNNASGKISVKSIEKEWGLEKFVPHSQLENLKLKEIRKCLTHQFKLNQNLTPPGQKHLSSLQAKLHYMKIISELKMFGSRVFMVTMLDKKAEAMLLVGPKAGVSLITNIKHYTLSVLAEFEQLEKIKVAKESNNMQKIEITVKGEELSTLNVGLLKDESINFVGMVEGYYKVFVDGNRNLVEKPASKQSADPDVPPYFGKHRVVVSPWSYPEDIVSQVIPSHNDKDEILENERIVDLSGDPPAYDESDVDYIAKIKHDILGTQPENKQDDVDSVSSDGIISLVGVNNNNNSQSKQTVQKSVIVVGSNILPSYVEAKEKKLPVKRNEFQSIDEQNQVKRQRTEECDTNLTNGEIYKQSSVIKTINGNGEELSDTDSGVESEKKIPLEEPLPGSQGQDPESDDTDSWDTPANSPAKVSESFGLHSPDELPRTESDFEVIASSFGLLSPDRIPPEIQEGILDPKMFSERRLYLDPDIIDLTLMPPPPQPPPHPPADNSVAMATWHPPVQSNASPLDEEASHVTEAPDLPTSPPPPLNRSASTGDSPDFFDSDIDDFIAKLMVPPPPSESQDPTVEHNEHILGHTWSGPVTYTQEHVPNSDGHLSDDDNYTEFEENLNSLVIPPPPGEASATIDHIPIVPPIESVSENSKRKRSSHKRSSSVDTFFMKFSKDSSQAVSPPDSQKQSNENVDAFVTNTAKDDHSSNQSSQDTNSSSSDINTSSKDFESPGSISEKLSTLLQMIPNFTNVEESEKNFRRTSSLRVYSKPPPELAIHPADSYALTNGHLNSVKSEIKGASVKAKTTDLVKNDNIHTSQEKENRKNGETVMSKKEANIRSKYSRHLRRTGSFDVLPVKQETEEPVKAVSETFSSLKAKLQSYRDFLLNKTSGTRKDKTPLPDMLTEKDSEKPKSPLKRSNSFTLNFLKRRSSSSDSDESSEPFRRTGSDLNLSRSRRRDRKSKEEKKTPSEEKDKKPPALWSTFTAPKSFRPHTSVTVQHNTYPPQRKETRSSNLPAGVDEKSSSKKAGPMKALSMALKSSPTEGKMSLLDKAMDSGPVVVSKEREQAKETKDDIAISNSHSTNSNKKAKENPFGTVNNMWRPISMSKSSSIRTNDSEETFRAYNNFDALRDLSVGKTPPQEETKVQVPKRTKSPTISKSTSVRKGSVSEESFAVVDGTMSQSHSDSVKQILSKAYKVTDFVQATLDADRLLSELKKTMETLKDSRIDRKSGQFGMCKEELINQVKHFVNDAKFLVSNAAQSHEKMAGNLDSSMHTLARIFLHVQATMIMMEGVHQAQHVGFEVIKMTNAYKSTVNAAKAAVGKHLGDPHMRYLMRQATHLAQLISSLLKTLKSLEQS